MMPGMPSCREVTLAVAGEQLERAWLGRRLMIRLHLMMCDHCRRYAEQIRALAAAARELAASESTDIARLQRAILGGADDVEPSDRE
jgi:anti-sigma factor ChrR (cupin superfamily)